MYDTQRTEVLERALEHYSKRLKNLTEDKDEQIQAGNDIFKNDLFMDAKEAEQLLSKMRDPDVLQQAIEQDREILCSALLCYINDLERSKTIARKKLADANPTFQHVDKEIRIASAVKTEICKSR